MRHFFLVLAAISAWTLAFPALGQITNAYVQEDLNYGYQLTAAGPGALNAEFNSETSTSGCTGNSSCGIGNTAFGDYALYISVTAAYNTAVGDRVLFANTTGSANTPRAITH